MADGVLFVYHRPTRRQFVDAANVDENIAAFPRHSKLPGLGAEHRPRDASAAAAARVRRGGHPLLGLPPARARLPARRATCSSGSTRSSAYKIATFQDEHHYCGRRFAFLNDHEVDCVYTMLEPPYAEQVYGEQHESVEGRQQLPRATSAPSWWRPRRSSRSRTPSARSTSATAAARCPPTWGPGPRRRARSATASPSSRRAAASSLDIGTGEQDRLYGDDWNRFVGNSKGTLGVESGVSCFDLRDEVRAQWEALAADGHEPTVAEMQDGALGEWDWKIPYRTISPRNFEAAAIRMCQILYEGRLLRGDGADGALHPAEEGLLEPRTRRSSASATTTCAAS